MVDPAKPTRDQLAKVAGDDFRLLRSLERLFEVSGTETPSEITEITNRLDGAEALVSAALVRPAPDRESLTAVLSRALHRSTTFLSHAMRGLLRGNVVFVSDWTDFPRPVSGVITLRDNYTYYVTKEVDLQGNYLLGGQNTAINGGSSENSRLKSTGLSASTGLITSEWSITLRDITLDGVSGGQLLDLDASGNANQAIDWRNVNFENTDNIGTIANYGNFVGETIGILGAAGWVFDGTVGTIAFANTLFSGTSTGTIISVPATAVIERRFRVIYSAVVVPTGGTGFDVSTSASIPVEGYIFDFCNFAGGGTLLSGVDYTYNEARFLQNRGITNTAVVSGYYMHGNATTTTISATGTPVKVAGTTTESAISQKFDNSTTNRALYEGAIPRNFEVQIVFSLSSGSNNQIGFYVAKNGTELNESETYVTTDAGGVLENGYVQVLVPLEDGDYIEAFVENNTATNNVLVDNLNLIVKEVG